MVNSTVIGPDFPHSYSFAEISAILEHPRKHLVVGTSGSTGVAKQVLISSAALRASTQAAVDFLGSGQWLLALPTDHIAGINVLARSAYAGYAPVSLPSGARFTQETFVAASAQLQSVTRHVSLVPTQLHRLLTPSSLFDETLAALQGFSTVLVGGAATAPQLLADARSLGINVVTSYGMSETCGGCFYDGVSTGDSRARIDEDNRIWIAGSTLADGYIVSPLDKHDPECVETHEVADARAFVTDPYGERWHITNDLGVLTEHKEPSAQPLLDVLGRADDTILSGGLNIVPTRIDAFLTGRFGISESLTVGIPDQEWGARVTTLVTQRTAHELDMKSIRKALTDNLGVGYAPRTIHIVDQLPMTSSNKPDRRKAEEIVCAIESIQK